MADKKPKKNPERYFKRERIYKQHPEVAKMGKLSDALKEGPQHDAARDALAVESIKGPADETHYGRIRRLNNEWNEAHPIHREHKVELEPWHEKPYNARMLHHHQFGIPNGGGPMPKEYDDIIVRSHAYKNDDGTTGQYTKMEQVPHGWELVEGVGKALGVSEGELRGRLTLQGKEGEYPKDFGGGGIEKRRQVAKEFGLNAAKHVSHEDPDPWRKERRN